MTAAESTPQPDPGAISYVTEIDHSSPVGEPLHHLFLPMREPEPLPEPQPEAVLEAAREGWGPEWPPHLSLTDIESEPEPEPEIGL